MKFLKGFALAVLGLLLFLSLAVFGLAFTLESTVLNPNFAVREVNRLDISALSGDFIKEVVSGLTPEEMQFLEENLPKIIDELEPQLKEQMDSAIRSGYDYFLGKTDRLSIVISLASLKDGLKARLQPPYDQYAQDIMTGVPDTYTVSESDLPADAMPTISRVREIIGYFKIGYYVLIAFMVLLVGLIILIDRNIRGATRSLGINFLVYGVLEFAGAFIARYYVPSLPLGDIPASVQTWLTGLMKDLMSPALIFGIGLAVVGVVLLVVSFFVKPPAAEA